MEDSRIVELYWQRNEAAIGHTQKKYGSYLLKIACNILVDREDADESVNDTYLAAWDSMPPQKPGVLSSYLGKLTRRISIDLLRRKTADKRGGGQYALCLEELHDCAGGTDPEEAAQLQQLAAAIGAFLKTQSQEARQVFLCRYYYMDAVKDIARYCGMTESKVKVLLHRTRQGLKTHLEKEGFDL